MGNPGRLAPEEMACSFTTHIELQECHLGNITYSGFLFYFNRCCKSVYEDFFAVLMNIRLIAKCRAFLLWNLNVSLSYPPLFFVLSLIYYNFFSCRWGKWAVIKYLPSSVAHAMCILLSDTFVLLMSPKTRHLNYHLCTYVHYFLGEKL